LSIRHELKLGDHAWSRDLHIIEFRACYEKQYVITTILNFTSIVFSTTPLKNFFNKMFRDDNSPNSIISKFDFTLLRPSKVFFNPPKVGEKVQVCTISLRISCDTSIDLQYSFRDSIRSSTKDFDTIRESRWWTTMR
jgi:hypothetical protein